MLATHYEPAGRERSDAIQVDQVSHYYGIGESRKQVLYNNNLRVRGGEIVIMTGQSGSGKTTLLTLIGTLRRVQEGKLNVLSRGLHEAADAELVELRKQIGFIFQAHNLFDSLTALENVRMALELQKDRGTRVEQNRRCCEILEAVGLGERLHYKPGRLSGGQKQRVAVARGLVHQPRIVLADEPTAALDAESGRQVVTLFQDLAKKQNVAIVIVTHDNRILDVADRIVKMDFGSIVRDTRLVEAEKIGQMLSQCSDFQGLTVRTLTDLAEVMLAEFFSAGARIIREGDPGDRFFLIREGQVRVSADNELQPRAVLGPGEFFGETALKTGNPRNANVDAVTDVVLFSLDKDAFQRAMAEKATLDQEVRSTLFSR